MTNQGRERLGAREREIMNALFALGNPASAEEIRAPLVDAPTSSTVRVMLAAGNEGISPPLRGAFLAMANRHDLRARVLAVLDLRQPRGQVERRWTAIALTLATLLAVMIAPLRALTQASAATQAGVRKKDRLQTDGSPELERSGLTRPPLEAIPL